MTFGSSGSPTGCAAAYLCLMTDTGTYDMGSTAWFEMAVADNHRALFRIEAEAAGGEERHMNGLTWTFAGPSHPATISFPELPADGAGAILDKLMGSFFREPPASAGFWSLDPTMPADLGLMLLARGFQPGWRPDWMSMDLQAWNADGKAAAFEGLVIVEDNDSDLRSVGMLPYADSRTALKYKWDVRNTKGGKVHIQRFVAKVRKDVIGHACVLCTTGPLAVAGIYEVGVVHKARKHGIGKALVEAACRYARNLGYHYTVLNATRVGKSVYEKVGFRSFGQGWTWWLLNDRWRTEPLTITAVCLAEAIGRGDLDALNGMDIPADILDNGMMNGMSYIDLAVQTQQPASATWLIKKGLNISPLQAWDLGWQDQAGNILKANPDQVDATYGQFSQTLMHTAVERNDEHLARMLLSLRPNLAIKDSIYRGTALDWARYFGRENLVHLLESASQA